MTTKKKASMHGARRVTASLDTIATLIQSNHDALGIPAKVAMDFAYRCDMLSDAIQKPFGAKNASFFNPATIAETVPGPLETLSPRPEIAGHFTQERFTALSDKQESGALARGAQTHSADPKLAAFRAASLVMKAALELLAGEEAPAAEEKKDDEKKAAEAPADEKPAEEKKAAEDADKDVPADDEKKAAEGDDEDADAKKSASLFGLFDEK